MWGNIVKCQLGLRWSVGGQSKVSVRVRMECGGNIVKCQLGLRWSVGGQSKVSVRVRMECGGT